MFNLPSDPKCTEVNGKSIGSSRLLEKVTVETIKKIHIRQLLVIQLVADCRKNCGRAKEQTKSHQLSFTAVVM